MPPPGRRSRHVIDDEEEEQRPRQRQRREEPESEEEDEEDYEGDTHNGIESPDSQLVKKLVRYAMACDFSRTPIRRDGIKDKVLGDQSRSFRRIFDGAQKVLRTVFGMEMVELPVREKLTKEEKRKAAKSQNKSVASNAYILVSIIPEAYRTPKIIKSSRVVSTDEEAAYVAFYTMIISLIRINGGELSEPMLKRYLTRLNAETNTFNANKTEDTLAKLQRQGYLVKMVDREAKASGEAENATTWYVGPRGKVEVGDETVAGLVRAVWGSENQGDDLESKLHASLNIRERDEPRQQNGENDDEEDESRLREDTAEENGGPSRRRSGRRRQVEEEEEEDEEDEEEEDEEDEEEEEESD